MNDQGSNYYVKVCLWCCVVVVDAQILTINKAVIAGFIIGLLHFYSILNHLSILTCALMECVILAFQVKSVGENGFGGMRVCVASVERW